MADHEDANIRIEKLEMIAAEQERTIDDLSSALTDQFKQIEMLKHELVRLGAQVEEMGAHPALSREPDAPPPHY